jgi:hypothetical protein
MFEMRFILPLLLGSALYYQNTSSFIVKNNVRGFPLLKNIFNRDAFISRSSSISAKTKEKAEEWDIDDKWATVNIDKEQPDEIEELLGWSICFLHLNFRVLLLVT